MISARPVTIRPLGRVDYVPTFAAMQAFNARRGRRQTMGDAVIDSAHDAAHATNDIADEIWLCEHPPVFTQGLSGKAEHLLRDIGIPVIPIDRGGQITYHGPGQVVAYLMLDLRRRSLKVRELVTGIEQAVINLLATYGIGAQRSAGAPGVYVGAAKIAALGLRIKNGCSYHGVSVNVDMDLTPYAAINPCGYAGLAVTQLRDLCGERDSGKVGAELAKLLVAHLEDKQAGQRDEVNS